MKIGLRLVLGFLSITLLVVIVGYITSNASQKVLQKSIEENTISLAVETLHRIDGSIYSRIEHFMEYSKDSTLQETILESNQKFEESGDVITYVNNKDKDWTSAPKKEVTPFMQEIINNELSNELREMLKFYEHKYDYKLFGEIFVTNKYGANAAQTGKTTDYKQNDEEWWMRTKKDGLFVGDVEYDESADIYSTDIGIRIDDKNGSFIGTIKIVLNIAEAVNIIKEIETRLFRKDCETMEYTLITKEGNIICSTKDFNFLENDPDLLSELKHQEDGYTSKYIGKDNERDEILAVYASSKGHKEFKGLGWILLVERKTAEIFAPVNNLRKNILVVSLVVTIFALVLGFFISRSIAKPITKLRDATTQIGKGILDIKIDVNSDDEIGQLAASFKKMAKDLQETTVSRDYVDNIIENMRDCLIVVTLDGKIKTVNQATLDLLVYTKDELLNQPIDVVLTEGSSSGESAFNNLIKKDYAGIVEKTYLSRDGRKIPVLFSASVMRDVDDRIQGVICMALDITDRKQAEVQIKASLKEKEILLQEIHHRVKNNLQVIISLLKLQSKDIKDQRILQMFRKSQDRINSIALIHENIYCSEDLANIKLSKYIGNLANELFKSYSVRVGRVTLKMDIEDISIGIDTSIPCGLIINELLSNSLKHAFPEDGEGKIRIEIHSTGEDEFNITFSDNGIGLPEMFDFRNSPNFGFRVIVDLVEYKLKGTIELVQGEGTQFHVRFKEIRYRERI